MAPSSCWRSAGVPAGAGRDALAPGKAGCPGLPGAPEEAPAAVAAAVDAARPASGAAASLHAAAGGQEAQAAEPWSPMEQSSHALPAPRAEADWSPSLPSLPQGLASAGPQHSTNTVAAHAASLPLHSGAGEAAPGGLPNIITSLQSDVSMPQVLHFTTCSSCLWGT